MHRPTSIQLPCVPEGALYAEHSGQVIRGPWKLPGLGSPQGVEELDIRLPPLPARGRFGDHYDVRATHSEYVLRMRHLKARSCVLIC